MRLSSRIAGHRWTFAVVSRLIAGWLRLVHSTSRIEEDGWEDVARAIEEHGAVIMLCWHQRLMMSPFSYRGDTTQFRTLTADKRPGRLAGQMQGRFGLQTIAMPENAMAAGQIREVIRGLRRGISIGLAADGPEGPARVAKQAPIQWARIAQVPVFAFTYSARRFWTFGTWDRLMFPLPFNRIVLAWRRWPTDVPRGLSDAETEALARDLTEVMDAVTAEADRKAGHATAQR